MFVPRLRAEVRTGKPEVEDSNREKKGGGATWTPRWRERTEARRWPRAQGRTGERYKLVLCPSNSGAIDEFGGDWGVKTTLAAPAAEHKASPSMTEVSWNVCTLERTPFEWQFCGLSLRCGRMPMKWTLSYTTPRVRSTKSLERCEEASGEFSEDCHVNSEPGNDADASDTLTLRFRHFTRGSCMYSTRCQQEKMNGVKSTFFAAVTSVKMQRC
ncbi:hypothetical protein F2P81_001380 [Scophthalmus maximus]|uniref:Uncharacterized protein n=1 Tax=Scophthalmus maximus TaxID=52904 RepID=A0A6A4TQ16_SCOMX|nr:hypothetical protein F2P81_001380 [Scophthalmus maximus]